MTCDAGKKSSLQLTACRTMECVPRVSIITPTTFSRTKFAALLTRNVLCQTYPAHRLELIVVGDTDPRTREVYLKVFGQLPTVTCKYYECDIADNIGRKRNFACGKATSKHLAMVDDDDYYHKWYVEYAVKTMKEKKVNIVACRDMIVFFPLHSGKMTMVRGSTGHEATFVFTKRHWKTHKFAQTRVGEGATMIAGSHFNHLDIRKVMICFSHDNNTYSKEKLLEAPTVDIPHDLRQKLLALWSTCADMPPNLPNAHPAT